MVKGWKVFSGLALWEVKGKSRGGKERLLSVAQEAIPQQMRVTDFTTTET